MRTVLDRIWGKWKRIASRIGEFQSRVLLSAIYFILVGPLALAFALLADPLRLKRGSRSSHWLPREATAASLDEARRQ